MTSQHTSPAADALDALIAELLECGGALSQILRQTPAVDAIAKAMEATGLPAIFLPFVLGVVGNMITGSTTVGVITSASSSTGGPARPSAALRSAAPAASKNCVRG